MANKQGCSEHFPDLSAIAAKDLLQVLLQGDEVSYPWNPHHEESEAFFTELEGGFELENWSEAEITARAQTFFSQLDRLWPLTGSDAAFDAIGALLSQRFAMRIPSSWLDAIARQATQCSRANLSLGEQLVQCVQELIPDWDRDDLQVLARPLAYAMRGNEVEAIESTLAAIRPVDWTQLSEMEQVRLSLAIARYALGQLEALSE